MKRIIALLIICLPIRPQMPFPGFGLTHAQAGGGAVTHVTGGCSGFTQTTVVVTNFTFTCTANATNNAIFFAVDCAASGTVTSTSLTATGWTITQLTAVTGSTTAGWSASYGALAPNTSSATFTATFTGGGNCGFVSALRDEFTGNSTVGGTTTFNAHNANTATSGGCTGAAVTPPNANEAVVFSCFDSVTAVGGGYTKGQDDAQMDWSQYKILSGGSGASQSPSFTSSGAFTLLGVTITP